MLTREGPGKQGRVEGRGYLSEDGEEGKGGDYEAYGGEG